MMPEERCNVKREVSPVSDSDDSTSCNNVQSRKEKKSNGLLTKSSSEQLTLSEREMIEREFLEARRLALERAQNDLLAGLPLAAMGLPFLPGGHALFGGLHQAEPLSLKMARPHAVSSNGAANSVSTAGYNSNLPSGSSGLGAASIRTGGRDSPAESTTTSVEPEDLSLRATPKEEPTSPKDLAVGDGTSSGGATPTAEDAGSGGGSTSQAQNWSFEEQFKQLYELSDDSKRKAFLDDLFSYMQKRGTPVTRIPIMAKQVLDLYQLYKLVVAHGGLVEVINKKLWREITKGLNLPPSITSAAFTLRTQYMKFLYPFECEREKLSTPGELQAAIDGNRREGRRAGAAGGYNPYSQISPTLLPRAQMNGGGAGGNASSVAGPAAGTMTPDDDSMVGGLTTPTSLAHHPAFAAAYREHLALEAHRHLERSQRNFSEPGSVHRGKSGVEDGDSDEEDGSCSSPPVKKQATGRGLPSAGDNAAATAAAAAAAAIANSTAAAFASAQERLLALGGLGVPSAHFKITGRGDGRSAVDSSLVVSMEINGVMYQGVLFAQPSASRLAGGASN